MNMAKKMYVIQAEDGMFFCGMRYWDKQLRKAKIYHSLTYAKDVVDAYEECNCKIVEVSLAVVPEAKTNADRIRAMSDEELAQVLSYNCTYREFCHGCVAEKDMPNCPEDSIKKWTEWLKQPAYENADRCVSCGEIIPEGRQVCTNCERSITDG
jgi:hypothetical protein